MKKLANLENLETRLITRFKTLIFLAFLFAITFKTEAQEVQILPATTKQHSISVELDPAPFLLSGYSFSARYNNKRWPHWSIMASAFAADFPNNMLSDINRENGWKDVKFIFSKAIFIDYHFKSSGKGLFVGPSLFVYNIEAMNTVAGRTVSFKTAYPNFRIGYTWYPFRKLNLYLTPWLNMGKEFRTGKSDQFEGTAYQPEKFKYIPALHLGYCYSFGKQNPSK